MLRRLCGDQALADDLAQQAFLAAFLKISKLKNEDAFQGWLRAIAVNNWLQHCRKHDLLAESDDETDTTDLPQKVYLGLDLNAALMALRPIERTCVVLNYQEGLSHTEISEVLDHPLGTIKSHITRGVSKLQTSLKAYHQDATNNE